MNKGNLNKLEDKGWHWQSSVGVRGGERRKKRFPSIKNFFLKKKLWVSRTARSDNGTLTIILTDYSAKTLQSPKTF